MAEKPLLRSVVMRAMEMPHGGPLSDMAGLLHQAGAGAEHDEPEHTRPREDHEMDPRSQEDDDIFLDPELFEEKGKPKKGEEILLKCKVVQPSGSKIVVTPVEVVEEEDDEDGEDDEGDEDEDEEGEEDEEKDKDEPDGEKDEKPDYLKKLEGE